MPEQFFGYSLQTTRCLVRLLAVPTGSSVSVEVFEDVGVRHPDASKLAEQVKSGRGANPLADRSTELWKTFSNWVDAVLGGEIDPATTHFEIFVTPARSGGFVKALHSAETVQEAEKVIAAIRTALWGSPPAFQEKRHVGMSIRPFVCNVMDHADVFAAVAARFRLSAGGHDCYRELRDELQKRYPGDSVDDILWFALGWVKEQLDGLIQAGKPAVVEADVFREQLFGYVRKTDPRRVLRCFAPTPSQEDVDAERAIRTYVRQLELIGCDHEQQVDAVIDFLRASYNRTVWSVRGYVGRADFEEYETRLKNLWKSYRMKALASLPHLSDEAKGRVVLADCLLSQCSLAGATPPEGFARGGFHALAEVLDVGWHPEFSNLLGPSGE